MASMRVNLRSSAVWTLVAAAPLTLLPVGQSAAGEEGDACAHFMWNVAHELAVMKQSPQSVTAGAKPGQGAPQIQLDKPYDLKLVGQSSVTYAVKPAKPTLNDSVQGGLVRFRVDKAGLYRVSISSGHWIDIVDGSELIKSKDFTGSRGCERLHKIVEFELPAGRDLTLQFSGSTDQSVVMAITPVGS